MPRDPAPSRLSYRLQRWLLTPGIRFGLRFGIPFVIVFSAAFAYLSDDPRREKLLQMALDLRTSIEERPEFMVGSLSIQGAGKALVDDIIEVVPIDFPVSSFDLDINAIHAIVTGLDPVKSATVRIRPGGVLEIEVAERLPAVIWRSRDGLALLDENGAHIDMLISRLEHPDLPVIAGDGADLAVAEALHLMAVAQPLGERLRGLVRMGERRWDVVLTRDQRILLPVDDPVIALERVIALSEAQDVLERDVAVVDLRLGNRPTLRMNNNAVKEWWRIRAINGVRPSQ
ncbi:MAG: cell division protein FtsQ/DivIB [Arenibacterium sp.]